MTPTKKVSDRSTKQEIWQAYDELVQGMDDLPIEFTPAKKEDGKESFVKNITELKLTISDNLDKIANDLIKSLNDAEVFRLNLEHDRSQIATDIRTKKDALELEIARVKKEHFEQEQDSLKSQAQVLLEKEIERQREEDEYAYELATRRRQENETHEAQKMAEVTKLKEREDTLSGREKEISEMEKVILEIPTTIEEATLKAKNELGKELSAKFTAEIASLKIEAEHQKNINELKTKNFEALIKTQEQEIDSLQKQFIDSNLQLKEMAVAVIEGGANKEKIPASTP